MAEISVDAVNMLGKITAEFRDAEARLRGLALKEAAQTEGMATTRAEWEAEARAFGDKKAAFEAELAQLKAEHQQQVRSAMDAASDHLDKSEAKAKKLVEDALKRSDDLIKNANRAVADANAAHKAKSNELAVVSAQVDEKYTVLADIRDRLEAIARQVDV